MKAKHLNPVLMILLLALFLSGCGQKEREMEEFSFLTTDLKGSGKQVSRFTATVISEKNASEVGEVNLAVKMKSDKGETIEFLIIGYEENQVYSLVDPFLNNQFSHSGSSGSSRISFTGRFFFNSLPTVNQKIPGTGNGSEFY